MNAQQKRRRDVLFVLLGLVAFTFFLAVLTRSMAFIALQIVADIALAGYVVPAAAVQAAGARISGRRCTTSAPPTASRRRT